MGNKDRDLMSAIQSIIDTLIDFDDEDKSRILTTVSAFFSNLQRKDTQINSPIKSTSDFPTRRLQFSDQEEISPKEFLFQKHPTTDVERIACLAYYLTHFRNTPHFKTVDLSKINTEAAQIKFSNAAYTVTNATNSGMLVLAGQGKKQISAMGELYVDALPEKAEAKAVVTKMKRNRRQKRKKTKLKRSKF